ncbi:MAG: NADP-dependent phosphogluconate dehydrogenase, partial [Candidatus Solibacter sp.]|nr:NADP-dependent phosphogluconate dehydrogenase [Candidatus Solibacter sp.]
DTDLRARDLTEKGILFLVVGVSGGEDGARHGASIMPGGPREAYDRVRPLLEAVAAKVDGDPCVAYLGPGSAGHFVKMVHNGIEYALMQLLAETYDLMKRGLGLNDDGLSDVYHIWNQGELGSYLLEITSRIFRKVDETTGKPLIDEILDVAKQKGTGLWTSQSAMELQVLIPTIDLAVAMRDLSVFEQQRETAGELFRRPVSPFAGDRPLFLDQLKHALYAGMVIAFARGMAVLTAASERYGYHLGLEAMARIWRGGCIIRAALLEDIRMAYHNQPGLPNLLLAPDLSKKIMANEQNLRRVVRTAIEFELPTLCFMTALGYFDGYRSAWLPANLIQAQRDYFGAHSYERMDVKGTYHTDWAEALSS